MFNENALIAFLNLAKTGSFQAAAKEMAVSSASFSRYIAQAEKDAGFELFVRGRNNSSLTRMGQEFLPLARHMRQELDLHRSRVRALRYSGVDTLRIGCGPLATRTIVTPALRTVLQTNPKLRFKVQVDAHIEPLKQLQNGALDIFVGDLIHTPQADEVELMVMQRRNVFFAAHPNHPIHKQAPCEIADILRYPFATPHLHKHWSAKLVEALGADDGVHIVNTQPQVESDDYAFLNSLLTEPDFIVGGVQESFSEAIKANTVKEVKTSQRLPWNICAARKTDNASESVKLFWEVLASQKQC